MRRMRDCLLAVPIGLLSVGLSPADAAGPLMVIPSHPPLSHLVCCRRSA